MLLEVGDIEEGDAGNRSEGEGKERRGWLLGELACVLRGCRGATALICTPSKPREDYSDSLAYTGRRCGSSRCQRVERKTRRVVGVITVCAEGMRAEGMQGGYTTLTYPNTT